MEEKIFRDKAIRAIVDFFNNQPDRFNNTTISSDQVFVVWECKTLQNNKAMLSTTVPDGMYYEFTWNGDKQEAYLDVYGKKKNVLITYAKK